MTYTSVWGQMISRCYDPEHPSYKNYGGRGIRVCDRWLIHRLFIQDMGPKPKGTSLNRIDNDGNYEPSNCEWASHYDQNRNKRNNRRITFNGETLCVSEWAEKIGMGMTTLTRRLNSGWSVEDALTKPINLKNSRPYKGKKAVDTADTNVKAQTPAPQDTDKVREAMNKLHADIMNLPCTRTMSHFATTDDMKLYKKGHRDARHAAAELAASMAAQAPVREVPEGAKSVSVPHERIQNWRDTIHDNERSMGDRLQSLSSTFAGLLNGDAVDKYPLRAIREQLEGEPLHAILVPDYWQKVAEHGNPPDGLYIAIYKGDGKSLPVALMAYGECEFDNDEEEIEKECGTRETCWTEYGEDRDGDTFLIVREVIAYLPVNLDTRSLKAIRASLPAAPVQQEGDRG